MWLPKKVSQSRLRAAENARRNRHEILKAWSQGQISRRDLLKWGISPWAAYWSRKAA